MSDPLHDRRRFSRIPFDASVTLRQGQRHWRTQLLDVSLKGLLVTEPSGWQADTEEPFHADLELAGRALIRMEVGLAHAEKHHLGFEMLSIDVESMGHLRRLVELNLGDPAAAERELKQMVR